MSKSRVFAAVQLIRLVFETTYVTFYVSVSNGIRGFLK